MQHKRPSAGSMLMSMSCQTMSIRTFNVANNSNYCFKVDESVIQHARQNYGMHNKTICGKQTIIQLIEGAFCQMVPKIVVDAPNFQG